VERLFEWLLVLSVLGLGAWAAWLFFRDRGRAAARAGGAAFALVVASAVGWRGDLAMQKLLSFMLMPIALLWLAIALLTLSLFARGERRSGWAAFAILIAYTLAGNAWLASFAITKLETSIESQTFETAPVVEAALLLGGGAAFAEHGQPELSDFGDRVMLAARLYRAGKIGHIVTSGSSIAGLHHSQDLSLATTRILQELGLPEEAIIRLPEPRNTSQEVAAFRDLAAQRGWKKVAVLSSAWHLPRILARCRAAGLDVVPLAADHRGGIPPFHPAFIIPQASAWRNTQFVAWELAGRLVGR
jgi:uncharacterized SAM-binding protein YcdF (DUF218 family)